jgi:hypothetical protein
MLNKNALQYNFYDALVEIENKSNLRKFQNRQFQNNEKLFTEVKRLV